MSLRQVILVNTAAPDRPNGSMVRYGRMVREALARFAGESVVVDELNLAPTQRWLARFPGRLQTPIRYAVIAARARRLLPKQREGLLHLLDGSHAYLFDAAGPLAVPLVVTVHDLIPARRLHGEPGMPPLGRMGGRMVRKTLAGLARADAWVADSGSTRDDLIRLAGAAPDRVHVVHPAVSVSAAVAPLQSNGADRPYVLHVAGNNTFYKNRAGVIEIFKIMRRSESIQLKMAGAPPDAVLLEKARASGVGGDIEFRPNVSEEELASLYRNAAFLLFPSLVEGFGWPPLEAMAHGCPVVCSNVASLPEVTGEAALLASPGDVEAFATQGLRLLRDSDLRRRLVVAGRQQAAGFSLEALARGLLAAYCAAEAAR